MQYYLGVFATEAEAAERYKQVTQKIGRKVEPATVTSLASHIDNHNEIREEIKELKEPLVEEKIKEAEPAPDTSSRKRKLDQYRNDDVDLLPVKIKFGKVLRTLNYLTLKFVESMGEVINKKALGGPVLEEQVDYLQAQYREIRMLDLMKAALLHEILSSAPLESTHMSNSGYNV